MAAATKLQFSEHINPQYDVELEVPEWLKPLSTFGLTGGYPADPVHSESAERLARHSAGPDGDYQVLLDNAEWRHQNLTILGLAEKYQRRTEAELGKHAGPTDPFAYVLGQSEFVLQRGLDLRNSDTWGLPSAMAGQYSKRLEDTVEHIVSAHPNALWDELAPVREIPMDSSNIVHWTVIEHQPAMARETTPLGLPTMVDARAHTEKSELTLYSIGGRIQIGFWMTEMGSKHWFALLISIANGILAASQYSAAIAISATNERYMRQLRQTKGIKPTIDYVFDDLADTFALMQSPHHNYFQQLVTHLKERARVRNSMAGEYALVTTPEAMIGLLKGNKDGIAFNIAGPEGVARLKQEVMTKMTIYDVPVFIVPSFRMPNNHMSQPFSIPFEVGERVEFFIENDAKKEDVNLKMLGRRIYTREKGWMEITPEYAAKGVPRAADGTFVSPTISAETAIKTAPKWWMNQIPEKTDKEIWGSYFNYFPYALNAEKKGWELIMKVPASGLVDEMKKGMASQVQIIGLQLHQRGFGHYAYWMLPGKVVQRMRKPGHAVVEDSFEQHVHQVSCQYTAGAACVFPKNLVEAKNVFIAQTDTGYGISAINPGNYNPKDLNGEIGGDMIYIAVPGPSLYKLQDIPRNLNVRGVVEDDLESVYAIPNDYWENAYPGFRYYDEIFGWSKNHYGSPSDKRESDEGFRKISWPVNIVARQMCYQMWDDRTGKYTIYRPGNGYWKMEGTYDGCERHRNAGVFLPNPPRGEYTLA